MKGVTVVTASLPERGKLLAQCVASVTAQTVPPVAHLIYVDHMRQGCTIATNKLVGAARTEWIATLADDDLFDADHLERLLEHGRGADVVYSPPRTIIGNVRNEDPNQFAGPPPNIPSTALIRRSMWMKAGGYSGYPEDNVLWQKLLALGASFVRHPQITWTYRFKISPDHINESRG